ncbi:MAG: DUF4179 domain-containing protein [Bacillota bacterium]
MKKAETETMVLENVTEGSLKSIINWFEIRKESFYKLARTYSSSNQEIQEVFYRTIMKVYDERKYSVENQHFKLWAASVFIKECRQMGKSNIEKAESSQSEDTFHQLCKLKEEIKEAMAITYLQERSFDEAAEILQISVDSLKSRLSNGLQHLSRALVNDKYPESCTPYRNEFIDYLGKNLVRSEKVKLEIHTPTCPYCQEELAAFQEVILSLVRSAEDIHVPLNLMKTVKEQAVETERIRLQKKKKRNKLGLAAMAVLTFMVCTGFVTGSFTGMYYSWMEWTNKEEKEIIQYYKSGLGEPLELVEENNGVKVTIKTAVADDEQTLIFYEVENMKEENQYFLNMQEGGRVENEYEILDMDGNRYYHPFDIGMANEEDEKIYRGKISLAPIKSDTATIELKVMRLQETIKEVPDRSTAEPYHPKYLEGEWSFEIPVEKHDSIVYEINQESEIEGVPIRINKLTLAPTVTLLEYGFQERGQEEWIENITMDSLTAADKAAEADFYGGGEFINSTGQWITLKTRFEPLYFEKPDEVTLAFESMNVFIEDSKTIEINQAEDFPQHFEYQGNELSIDSVETGNPTKIYITDSFNGDRKYERLRLQVLSENRHQGYGFSSGGNGVLVDKNGTEFDPGESYYLYEEIDQPRYFETSHELELYDDSTSEPGYPTKLVIDGYNVTKYIEEKIKIPLN